MARNGLMAMLKVRRSWKKKGGWEKRQGKRGGIELGRRRRRILEFDDRSKLGLYQAGRQVKVLHGLANDTIGGRSEREEQGTYVFGGSQVKNQLSRSKASRWRWLCHGIEWHGINTPKLDTLGSCRR
jgi:hypothetical protein